MRIVHLLAVLALLTGFVALQSCKDTSRSAQEQKEDKALDDFERAAREFQDASRREHESGDGISGDPDKFDKMIDATKKLEGATKGDDAKLAKIMRLFIQDVQSDMRNFAQHQESFQEGTDYATIKTKEDIDSHSKKVNDYRKANAQLTGRIRDEWMPSVKKNLEKEKLDGKSAKSFLRGFENKFNLQRPYLMKVRSTDDQLCEAVLAQHAILRKYWGRWTWDAENETPGFEDDDAAEAFNRQAEIIKKVSQEQYEAQQKLLELQ